MPKIDFRENKVLKLTNVLSRKVPVEELFNQGKYIQMLFNWVQTKGYKTVGPLIIYTGDVKGVDADGNPIIESRIMVQLQQEHIALELPYRFDKEIRVVNCLLARFNDKSEYLQNATNKLTVYAYENDLKLIGETYTVVMEQTEDKIFADVFMPVKSGD